MIIPYTSQQGNELPNDCGPACASMLIKSYVPVIDDYYKDMGITPGAYQSVTDLRAWMSGRGVQTDWVILASLNDLKFQLDTSRPIIVLVNYKPISDAGYSYYKGTFTHFLTAVGNDDTTGSIIVHDPYYPNNESGAYHKIPYSVFEAAWTTVPVEHGPNRGAVIPREAIGGQMTYLIGNYRVTAQTLNIRAGPGTQYQIVGVLKLNTVVNVTKVTGTWGQIGVNQWCSMDYLVWIGVAPDLIDVSHWEAGTVGKFIDWQEVGANQLAGVYCKATQGISYIDPTFGHNWGQMKYGMNVKRGAYHFFNNTDDPIAQAQHFLSVLEGDYGELIPSLDLEDTNPSTDIPGKVKKFCDYFLAQTGIRVVIYTYPAWWKQYMVGQGWAIAHQLWIANYDVTTPTIPAPWTTACMWQYTPNGSMVGIKGGVDFNKVYTLPIRT